MCFLKDVISSVNLYKVKSRGTIVVCSLWPSCKYNISYVYRIINRSIISQWLFIKLRIVQLQSTVFFSSVGPTVNTACLTCTSWVLSPWLHIPFGDVIVLMLFQRVLWHCVPSLQRTLRQHARCLFFTLFVADWGGKCVSDLQRFGSFCLFRDGQLGFNEV